MWVGNAGNSQGFSWCLTVPFWCWHKLPMPLDIRWEGWHWVLLHWHRYRVLKKKFSTEYPRLSPSYYYILCLSVCLSMFCIFDISEKFLAYFCPELVKWPNSFLTTKKPFVIEAQKEEKNQKTFLRQVIIPIWHSMPVKLN